MTGPLPSTWTVETLEKQALVRPESELPMLPRLPGMVGAVVAVPPFNAREAGFWKENYKRQKERNDLENSKNKEKERTRHKIQTYIVLDSFQSTSIDGNRSGKSQERKDVGDLHCRLLKLIFFV